MYKFNEIFFNERIENLNCQPATHRQKTLTDRGTLLFVLKYFKSNETCLS